MAEGIPLSPTLSRLLRRGEREKRQRRRRPECCRLSSGLTHTMHSQPNIDADAASPVANDCWNKIGVRGDASCAELERHIHCRNCPTYSAAAVRLFGIIF